MDSSLRALRMSSSHVDATLMPTEKDEDEEDVGDPNEAILVDARTLSHRRKHLGRGVERKYGGSLPDVTYPQMR